MIEQTRAVLYYLRRYLETHPAAKPRLFKLHRKLTKRDLPRPTLWKHTKLKTRRAPEADAFLFYLVFLTKEGAIVPAANSLFTYRHRHLLK